MSGDMTPSGSWRSLVSTVSRSFRGYTAQQRELKQGFSPSRTSLTPGAEPTSKKQNWSQWAGQKLRRQSEYDTSGYRLTLFPGWATRRYREPPKGGDEQTPFDIDVFVSGYACKLTGIGFNTRAGRTFLRLAKSFASLPKLPAASGLSKSTQELLAGRHLPPRPDEITEATEIQALDDKLRRLELDARSVDIARAHDRLSTASSDQSDSEESRTPSTTSSASGNSSTQTYGAKASSFLLGASSDLQRWHANLEARLHPFWSSVISNRVVRVSLYAVDPALYDADESQTDESASSGSCASPEKQPIVTREVTTGADGSFQLKLSVPWERMCNHPGALHIAFGGSEVEQDMFVIAQLVAPPSPGPSTPNTAYQTSQGQDRASSTPLSVSSSISIPLSYSSIRLISDIDDTVKLSGIMNGARAVFHNVFVKDLRDSVIRGMGDWYMGMWRRGVRFHYVSNGPFELLPVVNEFFQVSQLPPGSVRLRSYDGRSLFNGLLSAPSVRKRNAVLDVLNHFPEARFFLVGDSGEQDLELYADIARERPHQILAIFIRDASGRGDGIARPLEDPIGIQAFTQPSLVPTGSDVGGKQTGWRGGFQQASRSMSDVVPRTLPAVNLKKPSRSYPGVGAVSQAPSESADYFSSVPPSHSSITITEKQSQSPITEEPQESPTMSTSRGRPWPPPGFSKPPQGSQTAWRERENRRWQQTQTPPSDTAERKKVELQVRLWKVRLDIAPHIPIRIFREPEECVEVDEILERLQVRGR